MLHEKFHGNKEAMEQAIEAGDLALTTYQGKTFYSYQTLKSGRAKSLQDENELHHGEHKLDDPTTGAISDWMCSMQLGIGSVGGDEEAGTGEATVEILKSKQKEVDWAAIEKVTTQAKNAQEKLIRDSLKLKQKVVDAKDPDLLQVFKDSFQNLQKNQMDLDHILTWKALGLGVFFGDHTLRDISWVGGHPHLERHLF